MKLGSEGNTPESKNVSWWSTIDLKVAEIPLYFKPCKIVHNLYSFQWREDKYMINFFKIKRKRHILDEYFQNNGEKKILNEYFQNDGEKKNTWCCQVLHALCLWSWYWPLLLWGCRAYISLYKWLAIIIIIIIIL